MKQYDDSVVRRFLAKLKEIPAQAFSLEIDLRLAMDIIAPDGDRIMIGNLDTHDTANESQAWVENSIAQLYERMRGVPFIASCACQTVPGTPVEHINKLIEVTKREKAVSSSKPSAPNMAKKEDGPSQRSPAGQQVGRATYTGNPDDVKDADIRKAAKCILEEFLPLNPHLYPSKGF